MNKQIETSEQEIIKVEGLNKRYAQGRLSVDVLKGVDLHVARGEQVAIIGSSGSGKSTLLHLLGGLDTPTSGLLQVDGQNIGELGPRARGLLRNKMMGFIYQFHHLLPEFTALENVAMPLLIGGVRKQEAQKKAAEMLDNVGLSQRVEHKPSELSGGERQRAAIARALINQPKIVLADEPTGNLDEKTAADVYQLMMSLNQELNTSFLVVTHNLTLANKMDRVLELSAGILSESHP